EHSLADDLSQLSAALVIHVAKREVPAEGRYYWEGARKLALFYLCVGQRLQSPDAALPRDVDANRVAAWVKAIEALKVPGYILGLEAEGDITDFRPSGHYAQSAKLQRYFRAMRWY